MKQLFSFLLCFLVAGSVLASNDSYNVFDDIAKLKGINKKIPFKFAPIVKPEKPVTFEMGYKDGLFDEKPVHTVKLTRPFDMQETEVTQLQWFMIMDNNPSKFQGDDLPVETVSYYDVKKFIEKINQLDKVYEYRLPTEAEWEFAAGPEPDDYRKSFLYTNVWYAKSLGADNKTHPVGKKSYNPYGVKDIIGNVQEWVEDSYDKKAYSLLGKGLAKGEPQIDPLFISQKDSEHAIRGCGFGSEAEDCRVKARFKNPPDFKFEGLGFRLIRTEKSRK